MPIHTNCPNPACGRPSRIDDSLSGRSVRCKACGQTFVAGASATAGDARPIPAAAPPSPAVKQIDRFQIRERLGAGAFGTVYRAYDPQLDRDVALKVPNAGVLDSPARVARFLREAKASAGLRHPNIVPLYDAGKDGETYYIASAFIAGKPLADEIPEAGLPFAQAARLVMELASAAGYAHEQGVVHRDIKPANVMVDGTGRPHLMDFGLATRTAEAEKLTHDGAVMGTPAYMAPEQASGQKGEVGPAADQYALGVVLYELLTGTVPFTGPIPVVLHAVIHTEPDSPRVRCKSLPKDLETICLKAMAKRPADRYADCKSMAEDLRRWLTGAAILARSMTKRERLVRWMSSNRLLAGLSAAIALLLIIGSVIATTFAVRAVGAARDAIAARDEESAARTALAVETRKAKEAQASAEVNLLFAKASEAEARKAEGDARAAESREQSAAAELKKALEAAQLALSAQRTAEERAAASDNTAKALSVKQDVKDYRKLMLLASNALHNGNYKECGEQLAKCPIDVRGPEWKLMERWAKLGRDPGRDVNLAWPGESELTNIVFSQDMKRAALSWKLTKTGMYHLRIYSLETRAVNLGDFLVDSKMIAPKQGTLANAQLNLANAHLSCFSLAFGRDSNTLASSWHLTDGASSRNALASYVIRPAAK